MVEIDIHIPRPYLTILFFAGIASGIMWIAPSDTVLAVGGRPTANAAALEQRIQQLWTERQVVARREEILAVQLAALDRALEDDRNDVEVTSALQQTRREVIAAAKDRRLAEQKLKQSLRELWAAQETTKKRTVVSRHSSSYSLQTTHYSLHWPVRPVEGISAYFHDAGYKKHFGLAHNAIDIPTLQGTPVHAASAGVVISAQDNGLGFNAITIEHGGGISTLYGHVSEILVKEGGRVYAGQVIAKSGGMPGTSGAGWLSTGPHVHFEVIADGNAVDPLGYLPEMSMLIASGK